MMDIATLLAPERIAYAQEISSRKRVFERLAELLVNAQDDLSAEAVFDALTNREKLGSTALGNGVALPHTSIAIPEARGALLLLEEGLKMDAPDKKPVQVFMAILVPTDKASDFSPCITELASILLQKPLLEQLQHYREPDDILTYFNGLLSPPPQYYVTALAA
jgi:PTS system nitrogen regulatory IIA component